MTTSDMNVREILELWLIDHGYDGLTNDECGCIVGELMPCDEGGIGCCSPGYRWPCECGQGCDFHISREKPEVHYDTE